MISIKRGETSPFEASSRSFTSSISAFLAIRTFRPGSVYNPSRLFSSGRQAETALISLSSRSATSRDALFTATRRKKRFMILVSSLALVFLGSVAPLPQFPRGTFSPRTLGKRSWPVETAVPAGDNDCTKPAVITFKRFPDHLDFTGYLVAFRETVRSERSIGNRFGSIFNATR